MIGCGKYRDAYLFEVTDQDLLVRYQTSLKYRAGNILMFNDKRAVELGREFACADDLFSARAYLDAQSYQSLHDSEIHAIEAALKQVKEQKSLLEQELAERITEIIELNLQNDDLRRHAVKEHAGTSVASRTENTSKQIHILHEFPAVSNHSSFARLSRLAFLVFRVFMIIVASILVLGAVSVIATAQVNSVSLGAALDLIIESLGFNKVVFGR